MITKEDLKDDDNLGQCECGNYTHQDYLTVSDDGANSCPECQIGYLNDLLKMYKKLFIDVSVMGPISKEYSMTMVKQSLCKLYGIKLEDFDNLGMSVNL